MQGGHARLVRGADEVRALGPPTDPAFSARAAAAAVGEIVVHESDSVSWSEAAYRWHGRPRWRRVRTTADALQGVAEGGAALRRAYRELARQRAGDPAPLEALTYVAVDEYGLRHPLLLVPVGHGTALVVSGGPVQRPTDAPRERPVVPLPQPFPATESDPSPRGTGPAETDADLVAPVEPAGPVEPAAPDTQPDRSEQREEAEEPEEPERAGEPEGPERAAEAAESELLEAATAADAASADAREPDGDASDEAEDAREASEGAEAADADEASEGAEVVDPDEVADPDEVDDADDSWIELLEAAPVAMAVLDADDRLGEVNDALCELAGRHRNELAALRVADLTPGTTAPATSRDGERPAELEAPLRRPDGQHRWVRIAYSDVELHGRLRHLVIFEDATEAHEIESRLRRQALHDELTGLPNRRLLVEALTQALSRARRAAGKVGVFFVDVDGLKRVNDTHGHSGGDALILAVGRGLREALRESDVLARIGGDEFVAVCEDVGEGRTLDEIGQRIIHSATRPVVLDGDEVPVSVSVGVAVPQSADESAETLLARADAAMYRAKAGGGGRLWGGTGRWNTVADDRPGAEDWIEAMRRGQLRMLYEPVVTAEDGVLLGVVGKLRWTHPEHGELTGTDLLETREAASATVPLLRWAVRKVLGEVRTLGDAPLRVWLTMPARALLQPSVAEEVTLAYAELGGRRAPSLVIDVRERDLAALLHRGGPPESIERLTSAGPVALGIDGFRGDAVPIGLLSQLALRSLRLHSSLMRSAARADQPAARALLDGIVAAATAAGVTSIAAKVDDLESLRVAREVKVLAVQGLVVAPARTIDGLAAILHSRQVVLPATALPQRTAGGEVAVDLTVDIGAALAAETGVQLPDG